MSEKTEQPSSKRLRDERRKGNVPRSRVLSAGFTGLCALAALIAALPSASSGMLSYARAALLEGATGATPIAIALGRAVEALLQVSAPPLLAAFVGALVGAGLQVGVLVNGGAIGFKFERLGPGAGLKRIFATRNLAEFVRATVIAAVVLWVAHGVLRDGVRVALRLPAVGAFVALQAALDVARVAGLKAIGCVLLLGGVDYLYERKSYLRGLRMSREELKREHKESEGDPHHKAKRKSAHRALLNGTASRGVQRATAVVVNPTHVAVALRYDPKEAAAPTIVAKGSDEEAARIRHLARHYKVPIVRDVPLARALVRFDVGEEIPEELYKAAAVVLRKVYELGTPIPPADSGRRSR